MVPRRARIYSGPWTFAPLNFRLESNHQEEDEEEEEQFRRGLVAIVNRSKSEPVPDLLFFSLNSLDGGTGAIQEGAIGDHQ